MLLGTDMHILQGAVDVSECEWSDGKLLISISHINQKDKTLFIHRPDGWNFMDLTTNADNYLVDPRTPDLLKIHFNGKKDTTKFQINWARNCFK
jgi:hypothetical protein